MKPYQDISTVPNNAYLLANLIRGGHYQNILYYEFHETVDPTAIFEYPKGLEAFRERSNDFYKICLSDGFLDQDPAIIHVALKLGSEWFLAHDCGANYYLGYGPAGILQLREACAIHHVAGIAGTGNFEAWIKLKFGSPEKPSGAYKKNTDQLPFEKLIKSFQYLTNDMQRRPEQYQGLNEENIRDRILAPINMIFQGRGNAEAKNVKGKTDILVKTKDGLNEHIFELKVWNGIETLKEAIEQLQGYLSWHNNYCGIIMFCYQSDFTSILKKIERHLIANFPFNEREKYVSNEFRFRLPHPTDKFKYIHTHVTCINLKIT